MSTNNKQSPDLKKQRERYEKDKEAYKTRVRPLVQFLKKHKLRFSNAQVGEVSIEYFRLDDLDKMVEKHKEEIDKNEELSSLVKNRNKEFVFFKRPENLKAKYPRNL